MTQDFTRYSLSQLLESVEETLELDAEESFSLEFLDTEPFGRGWYCAVDGKWGFSEIDPQAAVAFAMRSAYTTDPDEIAKLRDPSISVTRTAGGLIERKVPPLPKVIEMPAVRVLRDVSAILEHYQDDEQWIELKKAVDAAIESPLR